MTFSDLPGAHYDHVIHVVARRDVEDYAHGRPRNAETARLVERALLEDDAARAILREVLDACDRQDESLQQRNLSIKPLQDLSAAAQGCEALADTYDRLNVQTKDDAASEFFDGRAAAFREAADDLALPLREQRAKFRRTQSEDRMLLEPESRERLLRQIREEPAKATIALAELHHPVMQGLRGLIHPPWPLRIKLLIAEAYALLTEETEASAWRLKRRMSSRRSRSKHGYNPV